MRRCMFDTRRQGRMTAPAIGVNIVLSVGSSGSFYCASKVICVSDTGSIVCHVVSTVVKGQGLMTMSR